MSHSTEWGKESIEENLKGIEKVAALLEREKGRLTPRGLWLGSLGLKRDSEVAF